MPVGKLVSTQKNLTFISRKSKKIVLTYFCISVNELFGNPLQVRLLFTSKPFRKPLSRTVLFLAPGLFFNPCYKGFIQPFSPAHPQRECKDNSRATTRKTFNSFFSPILLSSRLHPAKTLNLSILPSFI